jgi:hypothetical protein
MLPSGQWMCSSCGGEVPVLRRTPCCRLVLPYQGTYRKIPHNCVARLSVPSGRGKLTQAVGKANLHLVHGPSCHQILNCSAPLAPKQAATVRSLRPQQRPKPASRGRLWVCTSHHITVPTEYTEYMGWNFPAVETTVFVRQGDPGPHNSSLKPAVLVSRMLAPLGIAALMLDPPGAS